MLVIDTNVLVAATIEETDNGSLARTFLDEQENLVTTLLSVMEFRTVLTKKKQFKQNRVEELIDGLFDRMDVYGPETGDLIEAYRLQEETLLYPIDCILFATAHGADGTLVTFDSELIENGAVSPEEFVG
ncbi:MAG: PIN domain-containing protein [Euryarchaeota archaeon]|jgi:predicted nucleic acid-binding protein|nr:PIN domain-containing protein [Euryarchaeota archaeon]